MTVKKFIAVLCFGALAVLVAACGGGDATPTRTRVAQAEATQTPWIIYIPVTVTPGPAIATLEPTSTPSVVEPTPIPPTNTRPPQPTSPPAAAATEPPVAVVQPTAAAPAVPPTAEPPAATQAPSCGEAYQVTTLTFPENGAKRRAKNTSGAGATIQFKWEPVVGFEMDPKIGYRVSVGTPRNSAALYVSHNGYLNDPVAILNQQATYGLTQGDDMQATWSVEVIKITGEFNDSGDDTEIPSGTITVCGPASPTFSIELVVEE